MHPLPPPSRGQSSRSPESHNQDQARIHPRSTDQTSISASTVQAQGSTTSTAAQDGKKKRKHRGGKKRRNRRQSFAAPSDTSALQSVEEGPGHETPPIEEAREPSSVRQSFYRSNKGNLSGESLDSEALLDHRDQPILRSRRDSRLIPNVFAAPHRSNTSLRLDTGGRRRHRSQQDIPSPTGSGCEDATDRTPLISGAPQRKNSVDAGYGLFRVKSSSSTLSSHSKPQRKWTLGTVHSFPKSDQDYDVNNPPSVPPSPSVGAQYDDVMVDDGDFLTRSPDSRRNLQVTNKDTLIAIDDDGTNEPPLAGDNPKLRPEGIQRHRAMTHAAEGDVCFPGDDVSVAGEEYFDRSQSQGTYLSGTRRRRRDREWPQLWVLDEWSREEKEERAGERRAKKISEPVFVEGRLRPSKNAWHRVEEDVQYRYTYFNEEFESTIHAQTISELVQPGGTFRELFIPDPPELIDSSSSEDEEGVDTSQNAENLSAVQSPKSQVNADGHGRMPELTESMRLKFDSNGKGSERNSGAATPYRKTSPPCTPKVKKYGPRPTFWLDVTCPTDQEMRVLCKTFGIHALTSEDIMMQEAREKVELFRNYYFINYRTFEQDTHSEDYLKPINVYVCVFRHGILTFRFSQIPHPANVRRRIRQLSDYLILSADWISYAIIDDITDVYQPLITHIEEEVDQIDDLILKAFQNTDELTGNHGRKHKEKRSDVGEPEISGIDMLLRIGECRKKVMSLYRLLGNKADVIKGFAKRCNEQWEVAPRSEIGLYLGDIQDHILTMTGNLSHYETLLSRAHGNYLAQVSIHMNERQENTADVLGRLTVLGMFGANFKVPGQDVDNLNWFWATTLGLFLFGVAAFYWCKKVYKIV
ncbi:uncharacterized protein Z518_01744 [Rhinocladiella mackenziei CBS 650.93]|uniref:Magnesium transporter n=1 Tax=Rhinocladiella mackenziei CBS 650.93 TaxID=1442369 RepID=A0A0D2JMH0_9EURO|nr:uncharacterized protein Z518_01744 [Rhinocladiella mackenziei CBS 650.93]KIX10660.1 hypothetical protein Z518_01744 [Rhinocladiella mackenziei CBS 650.93]